MLGSHQLGGRDAIQFNLDPDESGTFAFASLVEPVREDQAPKVVTRVGEDRAQKCIAVGHVVPSAKTGSERPNS